MYNSVGRGEAKRPYCAVGLLHGADAATEPQLAVWWMWLASSVGVGTLGLTILQLCLSLGQCAGSAFGTAIADRIGTRATLVAGAAFLYLLYPVAVVTPSAIGAAACLALAGAGNGVYNVGQRAWAAAVESDGGKRHTLLYAALFSSVVAVAALVSGIAVAAGLSAFAHLCLASVGLLSTILWLSLRRLPNLPKSRLTFAGLAKVSRGVLPLALIVGAAMIPLGVVYTRGAAIMTALGIGGGGRAAALGVFAAAETVAQLCAWTFPRTRPQIALRVGGTLATCGAGTFCVATARDSGLLGVVGIALVGAGLAATFPLALSVAGRAIATAQVRVIGTLTTANLLAIASAPVLVVLGGLLVPLTLAAGLVMLACSAFVAAYGPLAFSKYETSGDTR